MLYATWLLGANYRARSAFYGAYPPGFLDRVGALFPDVSPRDTLHAFSGSLPRGGYVRCDLVQPAEIRGAVEDLPRRCRQLGRPPFALVYADPPYSDADAVRYGTPMPDRRKAIAALAEVTRRGGYLAWLDCVWPMHAKRDWLTVGRITVIRSTNHRVRLLSLFEKT